MFTKFNLKIIRTFTCKTSKCIPVGTVAKKAGVDAKLGGTGADLAAGHTKGFTNLEVDISC